MGLAKGGQQLDVGPRVALGKPAAVLGDPHPTLRWTRVKESESCHSAGIDANLFPSFHSYFCEVSKLPPKRPYAPTRSGKNALHLRVEEKTKLGE